MHNIEHFSYPMNCDRRKVQKELDNYVAHEDWQEGCTGLYRPIRWLEGTVHESFGKAVEAIERIDGGNYDQVAVLYYAYQPVVGEKMHELKNKELEAMKEYNRRNELLYSDTVTSAFIGCKECGSKLARKYLRTNFCPVCRTDIRPDHMKKSVEVSKARMYRAKEAVADYQKKHAKKNVMWLVKIEYHT